MPWFKINFRKATGEWMKKDGSGITAENLRAINAIAKMQITAIDEVNKVQQTIQAELDTAKDIAAKQRDEIVELRAKLAAS